MRTVIQLLCKLESKAQLQFDLQYFSDIQTKVVSLTELILRTLFDLTWFGRYGENIPTEWNDLSSRFLPRMSILLRIQKKERYFVGSPNLPANIASVSILPKFCYSKSFHRCSDSVRSQLCMLYRSCSARTAIYIRERSDMVWMQMYLFEKWYETRSRSPCALKMYIFSLLLHSLIYFFMGQICRSRIKCYMGRKINDQCEFLLLLSL